MSKPNQNVIPPLSLVRLVSRAPEWRDQTGATFRVGYYRNQDGLDCVWLVDDKGDYVQTTDQTSIRSDFEIIYESEETDLFGVSREPIGPRTPRIS